MVPAPKKLALLMSLAGLGMSLGTPAQAHTDAVGPDFLGAALGLPNAWHNQYAPKVAAEPLVLFGAETSALDASLGPIDAGVVAAARRGFTDAHGPSYAVGAGLMPLDMSAEDRAAVALAMVSIAESPWLNATPAPLAPVAAMPIARPVAAPKTEASPAVRKPGRSGAADVLPARQHTAIDVPSENGSGLRPQVAVDASLGRLDAPVDLDVHAGVDLDLDLDLDLGAAEPSARVHVAAEAAPRTDPALASTEALDLDLDFDLDHERAAASVAGPALVDLDLDLDLATEPVRSARSADLDLDLDLGPLWNPPLEPSPGSTIAAAAGAADASSGPAAQAAAAERLDLGLDLYAPHGPGAVPPVSTRVAGPSAEKIHQRIVAARPQQPRSMPHDMSSANVVEPAVRTSTAGAGLSASTLPTPAPEARVAVEANGAGRLAAPQGAIKATANSAAARPSASDAVPVSVVASIVDAPAASSKASPPRRRSPASDPTLACVEGVENDSPLNIVVATHGERVMRSLEALLAGTDPAGSRFGAQTPEIFVATQAEKAMLLLASTRQKGRDRQRPGTTDGSASAASSGTAGAASATVIEASAPPAMPRAVAGAGERAAAAMEPTSPAAGADAAQPKGSRSTDRAVLGEGLVALGEGSLDAVRGGLQTPAGLQVSFGIERAVRINGTLVTQTSLNIADLSKAAGGAASAGLVTSGSGGLALIQTGAAGNTGISGATAGGALGTIVQNRLDDQRIQSVTSINATVNSMQVLKSQNFVSSLRGAVIDSLRR